MSDRQNGHRLIALTQGQKETRFPLLNALKSADLFKKQLKTHLYTLQILLCVILFNVFFVHLVHIVSCTGALYPLENALYKFLYYYYYFL